MDIGLSSCSSTLLDDPSLTLACRTIPPRENVHPSHSISTPHRHRLDVVSPGSVQPCLPNPFKPPSLPPLLPPPPPPPPKVPPSTSPSTMAARPRTNSTSSPSGAAWADSPRRTASAKPGTKSPCSSPPPPSAKSAPEYKSRPTSRVSFAGGAPGQSWTRWACARARSRSGGTIRASGWGIRAGRTSRSGMARRTTISTVRICTGFCSTSRNRT